MAAAGPVLIAGGGIGGLALALALAKSGRSATVLEQHDQFATAGAGIQLGPNGVKVLERLGLAPALRPLVGEPDAIRVHDGRTGSLLASLPLGRWIAARHGAPYWAAHRGDLHGALLAAAAAEPRITLRTGFALTAFAEEGESVTASSAAGATVAGCALVGADGLWSRVRAGVCPAHEPEFAGATATRTVLKGSDAGRLAEPAVGLWLTPGAHVVHYPVRRGSEVAVVVIAREDWRGSEWDAAADLGTLRSHLSGFHRSLGEVLTPVTEWRKWALYRLAPLPRWTWGASRSWAMPRTRCCPIWRKAGCWRWKTRSYWATASASMPATRRVRSACSRPCAGNARAACRRSAGARGASIICRRRSRGGATQPAASARGLADGGLRLAPRLASRHLTPRALQGRCGGVQAVLRFCG